jgi:predicted esterase/catechol 2,3-dioxygenase-like lactoylglutathione lyase family enzyme
MNTPTNKQGIRGIHHITAVASSARENLAFYESVLGLRLLKQTVNFDDPHTYHLYFGDAAGTPGTILTFFPWEGLPKGKPGAGMVTAIGFAVPADSLEFWRERLREKAIAVAESERFGESVLAFHDPHGLPLELIGVSNPPSVPAWKEGPVPAEHAIRGFHSATALTRSPGRTEDLLTGVLGMERIGQDGDRARFRMASPDSPGILYDLVADPKAPLGRPGGGTVHHIAFRALDDAEQKRWRETVRKTGLNPTPVIDRNYFHSIYFREPGGVLFEIATDPPGFAIDEAPERLGESLKLPPQYESIRGDIEAGLPPLRQPDFVHVFEPAAEGNDDGTTLVALHGTGGNERDLVELARTLHPAAAILSPRGRVKENGRNRFFRRLAEGVLDEADVVRRANELADFLVDAARKYGRDPDRLTALGYSNGANIAAAILLLRPETFDRAVLLRPMTPLNTFSQPNLTGKEVLILKGKRDRIIPGESTDRLARVLRDAGAAVELAEFDAGHELTRADLETAAGWLAGNRRDALPNASGWR